MSLSRENAVDARAPWFWVPLHGLPPPWPRRFLPVLRVARFYSPRARARGAGVRRRKSPARGLFGGGRNLFLRALVVENDDEENEHHREDNGEAHRISTPPRSMLTHGLVVVAS